MSVTLQMPPPTVPVITADGQMHDLWRRFFTNLVTRAGGFTGGLQPADAALDSIADLDGSAGLLAQSAGDTFVKRTLTAGAGVTVTEGAGAGGNPTVALTVIPGVAGVHVSPTSITVNDKGQITAISP